MTRPSLSSRDWVVVMGIVGLLASLAIVAALNRERPLCLDNPHYLSPEIVILGAVAEPGGYRLGEDERFKDALLRAGPLPGANLKGLPVRKKFVEGVVEVPFKKTIQVSVEGAVEEGQFVLEDGARVGDLLRLVELSEEAMVRGLKKRTLLADGDAIFIPSRKRR